MEWGSVGNRKMGLKEVDVNLSVQEGPFYTRKRREAFPS